MDFTIGFFRLMVLVELTCLPLKALLCVTIKRFLRLLKLRKLLCFIFLNFEDDEYQA